MLPRKLAGRRRRRLVTTLGAAGSPREPEPRPAGRAAGGCARSQRRRPSAQRAGPGLPIAARRPGRTAGAGRIRSGPGAGPGRSTHPRWPGSSPAEPSYPGRAPGGLGGGGGPRQRSMAREGYRRWRSPVPSPRSRTGRRRDGAARRRAGHSRLRCSGAARWASGAAGEAVPPLPVPQTRDGNPGSPGHLADGQHRRTSVGLPGRAPGVHHSDNRHLITMML